MDKFISELPRVSDFFDIESTSTMFIIPEVILLLLVLNSPFIKKIVEESLINRLLFKSIVSMSLLRYIEILQSINAPLGLKDD